MDRCVGGDATDIGGLIGAVEYRGRGGHHGQIFKVFCVVWVAADVNFFHCATPVRGRATTILAGSIDPPKIK